MAGPAIIMFSQAQQLVYRRDVDCEVIVCWLQGQGLAPMPCLILGLWPAILALSLGVSLARMLGGNSCWGEMFN